MTENNNLDKKLIKMITFTYVNKEKKGKTLFVTEEDQDGSLSGIDPDLKQWVSIFKEDIEITLAIPLRGLPLTARDALQIDNHPLLSF